MKSIYDFIEEFEIFLDQKKKEGIWVYSGHTYFGSLLIKNVINSQKIVFKPSDSTLPIGGKRIQDYIIKTPTFKGHSIDNYIFVGRTFKEIAKRLSKSNKQLTLISVDFENKDIMLFGSMNVDLNILNYIIEFSNHIKYSISYDFEGVLKHQGFDKKGEKAITQIEERQKNPKVFFSYSWDNDEHRFWVLKLASDLIKNGIDVLSEMKLKQKTFKTIVISMNDDEKMVLSVMNEGADGYVLKSELTEEIFKAIEMEIGRASCRERV